MINMYDVYLAGPFFNEQQKQRMDLVKGIILDFHLSVADPRELGPIIVDSTPSQKTPEFFRSIFDGNIIAMRNSKIILACVDEKDTGTSFEMGFAYAERKPLISFSTNEVKANVMLGQAVNFHLSGMSAIIKFFSVNSENIKEKFFTNIVPESGNIIEINE